MGVVARVGGEFRRYSGQNRFSEGVHSAKVGQNELWPMRFWPVLLVFATACSALKVTLDMSPHYAQQLIALIEAEELQRFDRGAKRHAQARASK